MLAPSLWFAVQGIFHPEILMGSPRAGTSNKGGENKPFCSFKRQHLKHGTRYIQSYY